MNIKLNTQNARTTGQDILRKRDDLESLSQELQHAVNGLDAWAWEGRSREDAEELFRALYGQSLACTTMLETFGERLTDIANAFEQTDESVAANADVIFSSISLWGAEGAPGAVEAGGLGFNTLSWKVGILGGLVNWIRDFTGPIRSWLDPALERLRAWLNLPTPKLPERVIRPGDLVTPQPIVDEPPVEPEPMTPQPRTDGGFKDLLKNPRDDTPTYKQKSGSYECAPTSLAMILAYWNKMNPDNPVMSVDELIKKFGDLFDPSSGMDAEEMVAGIEKLDLGYSSEYIQGATQQTLRDTLENGPVMAVVHLNFKSTGGGHMVTVTGMSADGKTVYVNDPWTGKATEVSWETFAASWSWPDCDPHTNALVTVQP